MLSADLQSRILSRSDDDLREIVANTSTYMDDVVEAARVELARRKFAAEELPESVTAGEQAAADVDAEPTPVPRLSQAQRILYAIAGIASAYVLAVLSFGCWFLSSAKDGGCLGTAAFIIGVLLAMAGLLSTTFSIALITRSDVAASFQTRWQSALFLLLVGMVAIGITGVASRSPFVRGWRNSSARYRAEIASIEAQKMALEKAGATLCDVEGCMNAAVCVVHTTTRYAGGGVVTETKEYCGDHLMTDCR